MATGISKEKRSTPLLSNGNKKAVQRKVELTYDGKSSYEDIANYQSEEELTSIKITAKKSKSMLMKNPENHLFYGDNFEVLSILANSKDLKGKVKLIYIDPPFATKSIFKNRKERDAYDDLLFGAEYLEFLRTRLILMRELLSEDGSIYLHLDENMMFHAKLILDEVFGANNFRNLIVRKKCNPKNYTSKRYGNISDYILFYSKSENYTWNKPFNSWSEASIAKEYQYKEESTGRLYKKVPIHAPGTRNGETGKEWRGMMPPEGKHWQYTPDKLDALDAKGEIYWSSNGNPRRKVYLDNSQGISVQDIWLEYRDAHNQNIHITGYPTEKNIDMLKRIVSASSNENDLILDAFCGSGSLLEAAHTLERKWIGIDSGLESIRTVLHRSFDGRKAMGDFVNKQNTKNVVNEIENHMGEFSLSSLDKNLNDLISYLKNSDEFTNLDFKI